MRTRLRYGLNYVTASEVADQFYCEYKVHLRRTHPEIEIRSAALDSGEESHTELTSVAQPATEAEIRQAISAGREVAVCEWTLRGQLRDVPIHGRPDFISVHGLQACLVLDFKFTGADRPFRSQVVQAQTLSLIHI